MKKRSDKRNFFQKINFTKCMWLMILLISVCFLLGVVELTRIPQRLGMCELWFWDHLVAPLTGGVEENFFNLYISQISTTFLVTAFLSLLGDKDAAIYWTTAMDYKLVHPKGTSLKDFTAYSFCTLGISFLAIITQATLCFLVSFLLNIVFLIIITWRMIVAFYNRDQIKKELKTLFEQESEDEQARRLVQMEENIIRAAHDHNVEHLRECQEFLGDMITADAIEALRQDEEKVLTLLNKLDALIAECSAYSKDKTKTVGNGYRLVELAGSIVQQLKQELEAMYVQAQMEMPGNGKILCWDVSNCDPFTSMDSIVEKLKKFLSNVENPCWLNLLFERINRINNNVAHTNMQRYLNLLPQEFIEMQFSGMQALCRGIGLSDLLKGDEKERKTKLENHFKEAIDRKHMTYEPALPITFFIREHAVNLLTINMPTLSDAVSSRGTELLLVTNLRALEMTLNRDVKGAFDVDEIHDFNEFFSDYIVLFMEAYNRHRPLDVYMNAILSLCRLIEEGFCQIHGISFRNQDGTPIQNPLKDQFRREGKKSLQETINCFTKDEALMLCKAVCSKNALFFDETNLYKFLENLCKYTREIDEACYEDLKITIQGAARLDDDRYFVLTFLQRPNRTRRNRRHFRRR